MSHYTVKQLARLSGVSVRTLHHYDDIGLLKPSFLGENRYRYYGREELWRLQDILFHRELGVPLQSIAEVLEHQGSDRIALLARHREKLAERLEQTQRLLRTIDRTITQLKGEQAMKDKDIYHGFAPEKQVEYEEWLVEHGGPGMSEALERSKAHWSETGPEVMQAALIECGAAEDALVECFLAGHPPHSDEVEPALERHRAWVARMWGRECPPAAYEGLADLYLAHPDFRARYEARGQGFTEWLTTAMKACAARASC